MSYFHPQEQSWSFGSIDGTPGERRRRRRQYRQAQGQGSGNSLPTSTLPQDTGSQSRPQGQTLQPQPRYQNPFGTREEIDSEDYQSPLATMFGRAWMRYRDAEASRLNPSISQQPSNPQTFDPTAAPRSITQIARDRGYDISVVQDDMGRLQLMSAFTGTPPLGTQTHGFNFANFPSGHNNAPGTHLSNPFTPSTRSNMQSVEDQASESPEEAVVNPIDAQTRPPPLTSDQMTINIACRICTEQKVDTLFEPCMHVVKTTAWKSGKRLRSCNHTDLEILTSVAACGQGNKATL
ncbi:hypothetical protein PV10_05808 [Exophiala mesophila]|uniref:RING-type domain-containing protein n=1 Tax=Exophiala mesophila TaxID=212818 RepID=A0A0D1ZWQ4_EXOME|nr:uncharacterized protein PV10_05808 [Exophiala mesophila]KIV91248.1 hypothetical protein PV10_05808 [Exophiala mesophila]